MEKVTFKKCPVCSGTKIKEGKECQKCNDDGEIEVGTGTYDRPGNASMRGYQTPSYNDYRGAMHW